MKKSSTQMLLKKSIKNDMHLVEFKFIYMEPVVSRQFIFQGKDHKLLKREPPTTRVFPVSKHLVTIGQKNSFLTG